MLKYTVELKPQKEGGYTVTVPLLPGCISEGDTLAEALVNIQDAIEGYIEVLVEEGLEIPIEYSKFQQVSVLPILKQTKLKQKLVNA